MKYRIVLSFLIVALFGSIVLLTGGSVFGQEVSDGVTGADDLGSQSPIQLWELASAFIIPAIVQVIKRKSWDDETTRIAMFGIALVSASIGSYLEDEASFAFTTTALLKILIIAYGSYETLWKMKGVSTLTAKLGSLGDGPSASAQRAGYKGLTDSTPPPGN